jgi:3alpha(or 20beta)-hydroxysteroid dehydrogenase
MGRMDGKVAIITGGARGQGAAEARLLAREGGKVVVTDVNDEAARVADETGGLFVRHDVSRKSDWVTVIERTLERFGRLDVLVNNAAAYQPASLQDTDDELWDLHYRVNQLSVFLGMQAASEAMARTGGGSIVNISSGAALGGLPGLFAYATSKWAVRGMTRLAATDLAPLNIRVNVVFPGVINTPMLSVNDPERLKAVGERIVMGRMGEPDEVAQMVLFLASDASSYVTGAEIAVDGGGLSV